MPSKQKPLVAILIPFAFLLNITQTHALEKDLAILADGDRISGDLIEVTSKHVVLSTSHSGVVEIARTSVERLESTRPMAIMLTTGERIIGHIVSQENGKIRITSQSLGDQTIAMTQVATITPGVETANAGFKTSQPCPDKSSLSPAVTLSAASLAGVRGTGTDSALTNRTATPQEAQPVGGEKSIGQRPDDDEDIRKLFLRQSSVLLSPGQFEVEAGLQYQRSRVDATVLNTLNRELSVPLGLRVGLADHWQGYANLPLVYGYQQFSFDGEARSFQHAGIGDVSAGLNYQLLREGDGWPDLIASAGFSAPTGRSPYVDDGVGVALGSGHWKSNIGLQFIKTEDPVAIFGGLNYTYQFERNGLGRRVKPGDAIGYNLGLSFAINDRVSVSGEFIGSAQGETQQDGKRLVGTSREPIQFRTEMIYRASKDWYLAPTLTHSLNSDAPDVTIGVSTSHRFQ